MNDTTFWYAALKKPSWAPPSWLFGPVWSVLYVVIAVSFGAVFYEAYRGSVPAVVALPFALNLFFNLIYSPLQFRLKNNYLAALDILLCLGTLLWMLTAAYPYLPWVSYANIPYLLWVAFATALQLTITYLNR